MHAHPEQVAVCVHQDVSLVARHLLAAVVAARATVSVVRVDWLSTLAAVGWALRPFATRYRSGRVALTRSQVPRVRHFAWW